MSNRRPRRKRTQESPPEPSHSVNDVIALVLILVSIVHFLSLITYTPNDLPSWVSFSSRDVPNDPAHNVIGPLGALVAGYSYFVFGAASYLIPTGLLWFGLIKLLVRRLIPVREIVAFGIFVVCGACLAHFQGFFFQDWDRTFNILGPGGCVGYGIGEFGLISIVGRGGAVLITGFAYLGALVVITGLHPVQALYLAKDGFDGFREQRALARAARMEEAAREAARVERVPKRSRSGGAGIDEPAASPAPSRRRRSRKAGADGAAPASEGDVDDGAAEAELPLDLPSTPPPKIIDSSVRRNETEDGERKPTLAEIRAKARAREKKASAATAATAAASPLADAFRDYQLPDIDLLDFDESDARKPADKSVLLETQNTIIRTLATFGITVTPGDITRGPTITRYEIYPGEGLRVNRITNLEADLARATKAERINIIAPIPGKDTVGIEIANKDKIAVPLRELLEDDTFTQSRAKIPLALGKDVYGNTIVADLAQMPHLLVAGATGSGKSVCINSIVASLLFQFSPDQLRFIMIDPKVVEMQNYNSLPHLVIPVVTDPKKVLLALRWVVNEMERRYKVFAKEGVRNFSAFNARDRSKGSRRGHRRGVGSPSPEDFGIPLMATGDIPGSESPDPARAAEELKTCAVRIDHAGSSDAAPPPRGDDEDDIDVPDSYPYIVVIIDELADLMQTAPADVELAIARITQMARAAGIHLIVATQTPRADVITGVIKANIPSRIAFQVASALDSRVILDIKGAEKLVGKGDMLYLPPGTSQLVRAQGAMISDEEIFSLVQSCSDQAAPIFESEAQQALEGGPSDESAEEVSDEDEELVEKCLDVIQQEKKASTSLLQRRLRLGYTRAARMIDILESRGIIGPGDGAKPREILVDLSDPLE